MKRATKRSVAHQRNEPGLDLSMVEFQLQTKSAVTAMIQNALSAGFVVGDTFVIVDASPSFDDPVTIGWLPCDSLARSIPKAKTERMREAMQDLLDMPRHEGWARVLYYAPNEWQTTWLCLPSDDLISSKGGEA